MQIEFVPPVPSTAMSFQFISNAITSPKVKPIQLAEKKQIITSIVAIYVTNLDSAADKTNAPKFNTNDIMFNLINVKNWDVGRAKDLVTETG